MPRLPPSSELYLALDSGSPEVSVAVGRAGRALASRSVALRGSSEALLALVDELLSEVGVALDRLDGILVLRGPGSFTGLRVGLATALGLHLARGIRVAALPTLDVIALQGSPHAGSGPLVAAVNAQRGEWVLRSYRPGRPPRALSPSRTVSAEGLDEGRPSLVVGFGIDDLPDSIVTPRREAGPLAVTALELLALQLPEWNADLLSQPIYSRAPATTLPR